MILLVGLGNPTPDSNDNRHNIGFKIIDAINQKFTLSKQKPKFKGLLTTGNIANKKVYYSFNLIGWGVPTDSNFLAEKLRWMGGLRYSVSAIFEVLKGKKRIAKLMFDGKEIESDFTFIIGCNTIHVGKGMKMAPKAIVDDGKLDLIIVKKVNRFKLLLLFPKLFNGTHIESPLVEYMQVNKFSIIPKTKNGLNIDGEMKGFTPAHVKINEEKINIFN